VKHLVIFISVLLALSSAVAWHPVPPDKVATDTSVLPAGDPEFIDNITIGEDDDEGSQDGGSKKKSTKTGKSAGTTTKSSATTTKSATSGAASTKRVVSPTKKLAALTPEEENIIHDLPRKHRKAIGIELSPPLFFKYAILMDVPVEMINDNKLIETIDSWYGVRYKYGGETRKGIDCSAFTQAFILAYYEKELPRTSEEQYLDCKHIKKKKLHQGDLVFFRTRGPKGGISHVGVYLCNNKFVHASTSSGVMISDLDEDYFRSRYAGGGRIK
jgi:cell wall-associated NlpC family hydrolase